MKKLLTILIICVPLTVYALPGSGLVAYFPLDTRDRYSSTVLTDRSGNNITGTITGTATKVSGRIGQALAFSGAGTSNNVISTSINETTGSLTMSGWLNLPWGSVGSTNSFPFVLEGNLGGGSGLDFGVATGAFVDWQVNDALCFANGYLASQTPRAVAALPVLAPNTWHLLTCTLGPSSAQIYLDGAPLSMRVSTAASAASYTGTLNLGSCTCTNDYIGNGQVDDVKVWNRVLSAAEVNQLYREDGGAHQGSFIDGLLQAIGIF